MVRVLRILAAAVLLALAAAGCGGAARETRAVHLVPRALAEDWEGQASAIATAASTGDSCRALRLAESLRADVIAKQREVPLRLRSPLLTGVKSLAGRIRCTVTPKPPLKHSPPPKGPRPKPKPPKPKLPKHHGPPGRGKGHDK
ncbi:MAG TPA: hypothetical protein VH541_09550 [Gaiellaceae bacterium]